MSQANVRKLENARKIEKSRTCLPGFGLPVSAAHNDKSFPNFLFDDHPYFKLFAVREVTMMAMMGTITDKADWASKVKDETILRKWCDEFLSDENTDISDKMFDEVISELKYKATLFEKTQSVETLDGTFKSDTIISEMIRIALCEAVQPLENIPPAHQDWHPGSSRQVLDLVHPSLYPLVYGQTRILPDSPVGIRECLVLCGKGVKLEEPSLDDDTGKWSKTFQWLPCNVEALEGTDNVAIVSYINNLHPERSKELYKLIEDIIGRAIPIWDQTLTALLHHVGRPPRRIMMEYNSYSSDCESEPDSTNERDRWDAWRDSRPIVQPEPSVFEPQKDPVPEKTVNLRTQFGGRLQVIVKLANIQLTPESPTYSGGTWHVEGQANENICASALYYYSNENVEDSHLAFRYGFHDDATVDLPYEQDDHRAVLTIYGLENDEPAIQNLGSIETRQGRLLCFPNTLQHQVQPFSLRDKSKPGHRKLLALFLVDPHQSIISTANIPCQQKQWWDEQIEEIGPLGNTLPPELTQLVKDMVDDFPVSLTRAKEQREQLMAERKNFVVHQNHEFSRQNVSLCEH